MNNELAKTIATCGIWVSIGISTGFGLFRMNFSGEGSLVFMIITIAIFGFAALATIAIWAPWVLKKQEAEYKGRAFEVLPAKQEESVK